MSHRATFWLVLSLALIPAFAQARADLSAGERAFTRCRPCHAITSPDGTQIQRGGRTGPDLYGVIGRAAGSAPGFRYSDSLMALNAGGLVWSEESLARFVSDPPAFLRNELNDPAARTAMAFTLRAGGADLAAWLATLGPGQ